MSEVVRRYRAVLAADDFEPDGTATRAAAAYVTYAAALGSDPSEETHTEDADETRVVGLGQVADGRLGAGDREMDDALDRSSRGAYNDLFQFTLAEPLRTEIVLRCTPCTPHLTLTNAAGVKIEGDAGTRGGRSRIRRDLGAGTFYVWAGAMSRGDVGEYTLEIGPRR